MQLWKKLTALTLPVVTAVPVHAAETDFVAAGNNITSAIGLIGAVIDGIVPLVPKLVVIGIMLAIVVYAKKFMGKNLVGSGA